MSVSPFSCSTCRMSHRRCDRVLPCCGECVKKSKTCVWDPPCKRGRKGKSATTTEQSTPKMPTIDKPQTLHFSNSDILQALTQYDTYINRQLEIMPLFAPTTHMNMLLHVRAIHGDGLKQSLTDHETAYVFSVLGFVFIAHAQPMIGRYFYEKGVQLLGLAVENEIFDYTTACCIQYQAKYLMSDNNIELSRRRVLQVWNFIQRASQLFPINDYTQLSLELVRFRFLRHRCLTIAAVLANRIDEALAVKLILRLAYLNMKLSQAQGLAAPLFGEAYELFMARIDSDIANGTNTEALGMNTLGQFIDYFRQCETDYLFKSLVMAVNGYKVHLLMGMGRSTDDEIIGAADIVTSYAASILTYSHPPIFVAPILRAAMVHIKCYESATSPQQSAMAIAKLTDDFKALNGIAKSHKIIGERHADVIRRISEIVGSYEHSTINTTSTTPSVSPTLPYNFNRTMDNFKKTVVKDVMEDIVTTSQPILQQLPQQHLQRQFIAKPTYATIPQPLYPQAQQQQVTYHQPVVKAHLVPFTSSYVQYVQTPQYQRSSCYDTMNEPNPDELETFIEDLFGEKKSSTTLYDDFDIL
jgi:hypothetical protein